MLPTSFSLLQPPPGAGHLLVGCQSPVLVLPGQAHSSRHYLSAGGVAPCLVGAKGAGGAQGVLKPRRREAPQCWGGSEPLGAAFVLPMGTVRVLQPMSVICASLDEEGRDPSIFDCGGEKRILAQDRVLGGTVSSVKLDPVP